MGLLGVHDGRKQDYDNMKSSKKTKGLERLEQAIEFEKLKAEAEVATHRKPHKIGISDREPELELGRRLQEAREVAKLTQDELSERTKLADSEGKGISRAVLSLYEVGKNRPSPRELRMLCETPGNVPRNRPGYPSSLLSTVLQTHSQLSRIHRPGNPETEL